VPKDTPLMFVDSNSNIVPSSFAVSNVIAKRGKRFCDGECINDLMLETFLFEEFANKDKIIRRVKCSPINDIKCTTGKTASTDSSSRCLSNVIFVL